MPKESPCRCCSVAYGQRCPNPAVPTPDGEGEVFRDTLGSARSGGGEGGGLRRRARRGRRREGNPWGWCKRRCKPAGVLTQVVVGERVGIHSFLFGNPPPWVRLPPVPLLLIPAPAIGCIGRRNAFAVVVLGKSTQTVAFRPLSYASHTASAVVFAFRPT
jgi:hypothetical protein